jgi:replicative DNA helicase
MIEELDLRVLKAILNDKINALQFVHKYETEIFDQEVQRFAGLVLDYTKHFRSPPTRRTLLDRHSGNSMLTSLINDVWDEVDQLESDIKEFPYDLAELKKRFQIRAVDRIRELAASEEDPENPADPETYFTNLTLAISRVTSLDLERTHIQKPVGDYIDEFVEGYENRRLNPEAATTIRTGYSMIDELAPVCPGELILVAAETGGGKSVWLNNLGKQIWMQGNELDTDPDYFVKGHNVLFFSLEMSYHECFVRFLASLANVPQKALLNSTLTMEEWSRVGQAKDFINKYQEFGHYFDIVDVPRNLTIEEIELRYNDALLRYQPEVVIVDYMGLMHSTALAKEADWLKLGGISASLHEFARAYNCVMFTAAQLTDIKRNSQGKIDEDKIVGLHRLGRSSLIAHNLNLAIQLEKRPNEQYLPDMPYHIIKNRKGPLGKGTLIKNFVNSTLIDTPYDQNDLPKLQTANIPDLIKSIQESKNRQ